jgi:hypothetical protein
MLTRGARSLGQEQAKRRRDRDRVEQDQGLTGCIREIEARTRLGERAQGGLDRVRLSRPVDGRRERLRLRLHHAERDLSRHALPHLSAQEEGDLGQRLPPVEGPREAWDAGEATVVGRPIRQGGTELLDAQSVICSRSASAYCITASGRAFPVASAATIAICRSRWPVTRVTRASFIVRVGRDRRGTVCGVIERVATGAKEAFPGVEAIGPVIARMGGAGGGRPTTRPATSAPIAYPRSRHSR